MTGIEPAYSVGSNSSADRQFGSALVTKGEPPLTHEVDDGLCGLRRLPEPWRVPGW